MVMERTVFKATRGRAALQKRFAQNVQRPFWFHEALDRDASPHRFQMWTRFIHPR
jgi:hypothetical protein